MFRLHIAFNASFHDSLAVGNVSGYGIRYGTWLAVVDYPTQRTKTFTSKIKFFQKFVTKRLNGDDFELCNRIRGILKLGSH